MIAQLEIKKSLAMNASEITTKVESTLVDCLFKQSGVGYKSLARLSTVGRAQGDDEEKDSVAEAREE
jgi:hypothetical protein